MGNAGFLFTIEVPEKLKQRIGNSIASARQLRCRHQGYGDTFFMDEVLTAFLIYTVASYLVKKKRVASALGHSLNRAD
jgi:hypothetical protein